MRTNRTKGLVWGAVTLAAASWAAGCGSGDQRGVAGPQTTPGSLIVAVTGLPAGVAADVDLHIGSTVQTITTTDTVRLLAPGTYTIDASTVETARAKYGATQPTQNVTVSGGAAQTIDVDYAEITGDLAVGVDGLTGGTTGAIVVTGPSFSAQLTQAETLWKLTPGSYHVAASAAGTSFFPDTSAFDVRVDSARVASVDVRYHPVASLTINISGLPAGAQAAVDVAGGSFSERIAASTTLSGLALGTYTISPAAVVVGADSYTSGRQSVTLSGNTPGVVSVVYSKRVGQIAFQISGIASGLGPTTTGPIVGFSGPSGNVSFSVDTVLTSLPLGTYTYTVTAPKYDVKFPNGMGDASGVVYSTPMAGQTNLSVTVDSVNSNVTVSLPMSLVRGEVTFMSTGAPPGAALNLGSLFVGDSSGGYALAGTTPANSWYPLVLSNMYWADVPWQNITVTGAAPVVNLVSHYHKLAWPVVNVDFDGMPRSFGPLEFLILDDNVDTRLAPITLPNGQATLPQPNQLIAGSVIRDTVAWIPVVQGRMDYLPLEGQTITVLIHMRQANMLHVTINTPVPIPTGMVVAHFADGSTESNPNGQPGTVAFEYVDAPAGPMSLTAVGFIYNGTQYVPDNPTQSTTLGPGNTKFSVTYGAKVSP